MCFLHEISPIEKTAKTTAWYLFRQPIVYQSLTYSSLSLSQQTASETIRAEPVKSIPIQNHQNAPTKTNIYNSLLPLGVSVSCGYQIVSDPLPPHRQSLSPTSRVISLRSSVWLLISAWRSAVGEFIVYLVTPSNPFRNGQLCVLTIIRTALFSEVVFFSWFPLFGGEGGGCRSFLGREKRCVVWFSMEMSSLTAGIAGFAGWLTLKRMGNEGYWNFLFFRISTL